MNLFYTLTCHYLRLDRSIPGVKPKRLAQGCVLNSFFLRYNDFALGTFNVW